MEIKRKVYLVPHFGLESVRSFFSLCSLSDMAPSPHQDPVQVHSAPWAPVDCSGQKAEKFHYCNLCKKSQSLQRTAASNTK